MRPSKGYIQNKKYTMGKVALLSNIDIKTYLNNIYLLSYDTAINMHLFSYVINENEAPK